MNPGALHLVFLQGDSFRYRLTLTNPASSDPSGQTPGTPLDLTGASAQMQVRPSLGAGFATYSLTSANAGPNGGTLTLGGAAGTLDIFIPPADTATLGSGVYDVRVQFANGDLNTIVAGKLDQSPEVTQWVV